MKTFHIFHHSNLVNGVDRTTCTLMIALHKLGVSVCATVPAEGDVTDLLTQHNIDYRIVPFSCCSSFAPRAQLQFFADSASQQDPLLAFMKEKMPDIVHINTGHLLHAGLAAAQLNIPAIWHMHSPFEHDLARYQPSIGEKGYAWILEQLSSCIIGVSDGVKASLEKHLSIEHIKTLYNGIDVESITNSAAESTLNIRKELALPDNAKIIIGVGRISEQKNFASFVRVAILIVEQEPNAFFIIVGPKQGKKAVSELEYELSQSNITDKVFILGARLDAPALVAQSDCFLSTAIFEGHPLTTLEAMALRKPVVAMACLGLRECIIHNHDGLLVDLGDEQAAAIAVVGLLNNTKTAQKLGDNGKQSVIDQFSSIEYAKKFLVLAEEAKTFGPALVSKNTLSFIQGIIKELDNTHQRLSILEDETVWQHIKRDLWKIVHAWRRSLLNSSK